MTTIGTDVPRVDGALKVSGRAGYASDSHFPGMLYAVPVCSTIANGKITGLEISAASQMAGVRALYHRRNGGPVFRSAPGVGLHLYLDERRPPFEDDTIRYYGQYVAVAVADTF